MAEKKEIFEKIKKALIEGDDTVVADLVREALAKGIPTLDILHKACMPGMIRAGEMYLSSTVEGISAAGGAYMTDAILAAEAMKAAIEVLKPHLTAEKAKYTGKYMIGMVEGDIHTIGKDIVINMLRAAGWDVTDIGEDVPVETFIQKIKEIKPDVIGAAAAICQVLDQLEKLKKAIEKEKLPVGYMIGGWSTGEEFAKSLGVAWGRDAVDACKIAEEILTDRKEKGIKWE